MVTLYAPPFVYGKLYTKAEVDEQLSGSEYGTGTDKRLIITFAGRIEYWLTSIGNMYKLGWSFNVHGIIKQVVYNG